VAPLSSALVPTKEPIEHVVVIMQENRTFDNMFNGYPGADTVQTGTRNGVSVPLRSISLDTKLDNDHSHAEWWRDWANGKLDGFSSTAYYYVQPSDVQAYWNMARQYTLGDRMFQSNTGPSFVAHQYMIAAQSADVSGNPDGAWGCDAAQGTRAPLVGPNGTELPGVYPCFDYQTMADLLDAKGVSWRYYAPGTSDGFFIISAFQAIRHIRFGADWQEKVISPETRILTDIANGELAQVTWVVPTLANSDHPSSGNRNGPDWVASIVNAIGASPYWNSTAIFISWDDWGGGYDHVPPPQVDEMGLGFRVPLLVVSPYAKHGYVSHVVHESSGILRYMEELFGLPSLGARDSTADDFKDCFDYKQAPQPYARFATTLKPEFFVRQKAVGAPDDDD
jgi:phospholipase C